MLLPKLRMLAGQLTLAYLGEKHLCQQQRLGLLKTVIICVYLDPQEY